jgi:hypothetical protein
VRSLCVERKPLVPPGEWHGQEPLPLLRPRQTQTAPPLFRVADDAVEVVTFDGEAHGDSLS